MSGKTLLMPDNKEKYISSREREALVKRRNTIALYAGAILAIILTLGILIPKL